MHKRGIIVGKFDPLHRGHVDMIQTASGLVQELIVIVSHNQIVSEALFEKSKITRPLSALDKLAIVKKTFQRQPNIRVCLLDETDIPVYPNGWAPWSERVKGIVEKVSPNVEWSDTVFCSSEPQDVENYQKYFACKDVILYDPSRTKNHVSSSLIRANPNQYWEYLPRASKEALTPVIEIVGGESAGKTVMVDKLGNYYGTTTVWERGRTWVEDELGGDESALQPKDYPLIALAHFQDIKFAKRNSKRFTITDTKYVSTQAFSLTYEGVESLTISQLIVNDPSDLVIMLDNSTQWVDDGMRRIGEPKEREAFQNLLKSLYRRYNQDFVEIVATGYTERYELCKMVIDAYLSGEGKTYAELQAMVDEQQEKYNRQK